MAQCVVHQVVQVLAPGCVPLFLTDGRRKPRHNLLYASSDLSRLDFTRQKGDRSNSG